MSSGFRPVRLMHTPRHTSFRVLSKKYGFWQVFRRFMKILYSGTTLKTIKSSIKAFCEATFLSYKRPIIKQLKAALEKLQEDGEKHVTNAIEEILSQNCYGMAMESRLQISPWEFPLSAIEQPVTLYHAEEDEMIPFPAAKEMSRYLKNCTFEKMIITGDNVHMKSSSTAFLEILPMYQ